jgi:uncharacterized protein (DUF2164 family)
MGAYRDLLDDKNFEIDELKNKIKKSNYEKAKKTRLLNKIKKYAENSIDAINYYNSGFGKSEDLINEVLNDLNNILRGLQ